MACHIPPRKKAKKQGEMPLPSLGPIPLTLRVVPGLSCPRMYLGTTEDIPGMSQLPPPLHVVPGLSCPRMYLGTTEDIPSIAPLPPSLEQT